MSSMALADAGPRLARELQPVVADLGREHHPDAVVLGGGLSLLPRLREELERRIRLPVTLSSGGRFVAETGGRHLLRQHGLRGGVVADAGQTSVKVSIIGRRVRRILMEHGGPQVGAAALAEALASALGSRPARGLVLGVPCEIGDDLVPGPCTFPGWERSPQWFLSLMESVEGAIPARHPWRGGDVKVLVLNDAELAAVSASREWPRTRLLVLTLGYGPGAALVAPGSGPGAS
jgi:hypothetical protein